MKPLFALLICAFLGACTYPSAQRYDIAGEIRAASQGQAERQLLERTLQFQTKGTGQDVQVKLLRARLPEYPTALRIAHISGAVRVQFVVDLDGSVAHWKVLNSPPEALATLAIQALRQWQFVPMSVGGKPTKLRLEQVFEFKLEN